MNNDIKLRSAMLKIWGVKRTWYKQDGEGGGTLTDI